MKGLQKHVSSGVKHIMILEYLKRRLCCAIQTVTIGTYLGDRKKVTNIIRPKIKNSLSIVGTVEQIWPENICCFKTSV